MLYRISFSRISLIEKPGKDFPWADYMATFEAHDLDSLEILDRIGRGFGFAPIFGNDGYPRLENWMETQFIAVDMDTEDERSSLTTLWGNPLVQYHGAIIYPTHSHTEEKPRHRVVFLLDSPMRNVQTAGAAAQAFAAFFDGSDKATSANKTWQANGRIDADGLWDKVHKSKEFRLSPEQVVNYVQQYRTKVEREEEKKRKDTRRNYSQQNDGDYMSLKELDQRLHRIDPYSMDYGAWVKLGAAIAHCYGTDAFWIFKDWSDRPGKSPLTMGIYKAMMRDNPTPAGYGTIIRTLKERNA